MANTEVERYSEVDPAEIPLRRGAGASSPPHLGTAPGIFIILFLLAMLHGNHVGHVEDWFWSQFRGPDRLLHRPRHRSAQAAASQR